MKDFEAIKKVCERNSQVSASFLDEFLLYYAAGQDKLDRAFDQGIAKYAHISRELDPEWIRRLKAQYIIHKVFKKGGLLRKYVNHVEIKRRSEEEQAYLAQFLTRPWRFSFGFILSSPAPDFYEVDDAFSDEPYLLYSPATTRTLRDGDPFLWFNLIAFNGVCWQTYGPVVGYESFDPDDIFFYGTEVNLEIEDDETLMADVERNPIPYMLLMSGARTPLAVHNDDELEVLVRQHPVDRIDLEVLQKDFDVRVNAPVYRLELKGWTEYPHLAIAYYDEEEKLLTLSAATERGFYALSEKLHDLGLIQEAEAEVRVHATMLALAERILKRKIKVHPYEELFVPEPSPEAVEEMEKFGYFLQLAFEALDSGEKLDVAALAKKADIDLEVAEKVMTDLEERIRRGK